MSKKFHLGGLLLFFLVPVLSAVWLPPFSQPQAYHRFADARAFFGVPNFGNVASNLAFLWVAWLGLALLRRSRPGAFVSTEEQRPYAVFFLGLAATGFGSAWYHLAPDHAGLFWDRLPMTVCFGALTAAVIMERVDLRLGLAMLAPLVALGAGTVCWWRYSDAQGEENVLPYFAFQAVSLLALVVLVPLRPSGYTRSQDLTAAALLYALAVAAEQLDAAVFAVGQIVSGHTLKHLLAATAIYQIVRMLRERERVL